MPPNSILAVAWHRYLQQLEQKPLKTKAITASLLIGASDLLAQRLTLGAAPTNWRRTLCMCAYGFLWAGPAGHYWQQILESLFPDKHDPLRTVKKVLTDQLVYGPLQNAVFMTFLAVVVEGRSWAATRTKLQADFVGVQSRGWRVWPVVSFVNQEFVPLKLRVLWMNVAALGWATFLILQGKTAGAPALQRKLAAR
ncbi:hypothetical protein D9Q98_004979 [Chlorella vulgaris]|uniref:Peroxisomal membrane protein PMP22 n=1 Tax=Chlorella vulgaris TaxID=3077 RepID=A0A9D4TPK3_CHLVU|nr:hypothetical protein D9Q98_004979 [Chlorella vulgaris]